MSTHLDDTIAAVASAAGVAARGIARLSGPAVVEVLSRCFESRDSRPLGQYRAATVVSGSVKLPLAAAPLECDLYLWPDGRSYTRQPAAEFHVPGSPPLLAAILGQLCAAGARLAQPGEFTLRAFLAGRIDLTQAEAVLGVIDAQGAEQLEAALDQLAGGLAHPLAELRGSLLDLLAHVEAALDFADEDIELISPEALAGQLAAARSAVSRLLAQIGDRAVATESPRIVLVGMPNVGKSSLFNALAAHAAAIVSPLPGTTRDYLVVPLDLEGVRVELVDLAGVESTAQDDVPARLAQQQAQRQRRQADVRVLCLDATRPPAPWEREAVASCEHSFVVWTKCDLLSEGATQMVALPQKLIGGIGVVPTSSLTGQGLDDLRAVLAGAVEHVSPRGVAVAATAVRCHESLRRTAYALDRVRERAGSHGADELVAADLRAALDELGQVVGAVYTDDILDRVFSKFCIGK